MKKNAKNNRNATEELKIDIHDTKVTPDIFENISNEEMLVWLKKMPQNYFEVFNMFVIDELSHDEIAKFLNINSSLSRKRLSRAREWLKKRLHTDNEIQFKFSFN